MGDTKEFTKGDDGSIIEVITPPPALAGGMRAIARMIGIDIAEEVYSLNSCQVAHPPHPQDQKRTYEVLHEIKFGGKALDREAMLGSVTRIVSEEEAKKTTIRPDVAARALAEIFIGRYYHEWRREYNNGLKALIQKFEPSEAAQALDATIATHDFTAAPPTRSVCFRHLADTLEEAQQKEKKLTEAMPVIVQAFKDNPEYFKKLRDAVALASMMQEQVPNIEIMDKGKSKKAHEVKIDIEPGISITRDEENGPVNVAFSAPRLLMRGQKEALTRYEEFIKQHIPEVKYASTRLLHGVVPLSFAMPDDPKPFNEAFKKTFGKKEEPMEVKVAHLLDEVPDAEEKPTPGEENPTHQWLKSLGFGREGKGGARKSGVEGGQGGGRFC